MYHSCLASQRRRGDNSTDFISPAEATEIDIRSLHARLHKAPTKHGYISRSDASNPPTRERLQLIFDLDNTLLHAIAVGHLGVEIPAFRDPMFTDPLAPARGVADIQNFCMKATNGAPYYVKYRPFFRDLLEELRPYFSMSVHTNALPEYAGIVCKHLEVTANHSLRGETDTLFADRIIARELDLNPQTPNSHRKEIERLADVKVCTKRENLVILDDRQDVWDDDLKYNLIKCWPYAFFETHASPLKRTYPELNRPSTSMTSSASPASPDVAAGGTPAPNLDAGVEGNLDTRLSVADIDCQLPFLARFMKGCALDFYERQANSETVDIRNIIHQQSKKILKGCTILFTGFNKGSPRAQNHRAKPGSSTNFLAHFQHYAELMGAVVTDNPKDGDLTHCVCLVKTEKADTILATRPSVNIVGAHWLHGCFHLSTRLPEDPFLFKRDFVAVGLYDTFFTIRDLIRRAQGNSRVLSWLPRCIIARQIMMDRHEVELARRSQESRPTTKRAPSSSPGEHPAIKRSMNGVHQPSDPTIFLQSGR